MKQKRERNLYVIILINKFNFNKINPKMNKLYKYQTYNRILIEFN